MIFLWAYIIWFLHTEILKVHTNRNVRKFVNESEDDKTSIRSVKKFTANTNNVGELLCTLNIIIMCNSVCELCTTYVVICSCFCLMRSTKL